MNIASGANDPGDLRRGEQPHRSVQRDHVPADLSRDRDRSVEHHDVAASHAGNGRAATEHDDLPDHLAPRDDHVAPEHHLIDRGGRPGDLRERGGRPHRDRKHEHEHCGAARHGVASYPCPTHAPPACRRHRVACA